jgi:hypothetical protein
MSLHCLTTWLLKLVSGESKRARCPTRARPQKSPQLRLECLENRALLSTFAIAPISVAATPASNPTLSLGAVPAPGGGLVVSLPILSLPGIGQGQASSGNTSSSDQNPTVTPTLPPSVNAPGTVFSPPIQRLPTVPPKGTKSPLRKVLGFAVAAAVEQPTVDMVAPPAPPADPATPSKTTVSLAAAADPAQPTVTTILDNASNSSSSAARGPLIAEELTTTSERSAPAVRRSLLATEAPTDSALDTFFVELWDQDQLLFPDAGPPIDEALFPDGFPTPDDMPGPGDISSALEHSL